MPITITVPADTHIPGDTGHTTDHNTIADALTALGNAAANTAGDTFTGSTAFDVGVTLANSGAPATPSAGQAVVYASANAHAASKDPAGQQWMGSVFTAYLNASQTISTTGATNITNLAVTLGAGTYFFNAQVWGVPSAAAGTHTVGAAFSGTATSFLASAVAWQASTANAVLQTTGSVSALGSISTSPTQNTFAAWTQVWGQITVTVAGTFTITGLVSVTSDTWVLAQGSTYLQVHPVS